MIGVLLILGGIEKRGEGLFFGGGFGGVFGGGLWCAFCVALGCTAHLETTLLWRAFAIIEAGGAGDTTSLFADLILCALGVILTGGGFGEAADLAACAALAEVGGRAGRLCRAKGAAILLALGIRGRAEAACAFFVALAGLTKARLLGGLAAAIETGERWIAIGRRGTGRRGEATALCAALGGLAIAIG